MQGHTASASTALPYTPITADGTTQAVSTGIVLGNNTGNYSGPGGWVHDLTIIAADAANHLTPCGVTIPSMTSTPITSATNTGTSIAATVTTVTSIVIGMVIRIESASGGTWSSINGTWTVTNVSGSVVTFSVLVAPTGSYTAHSATMYSPTGTTTDPVNTPSNVPAICVNGVTQMRLSRVRFHGWGCGSDYVNNCGGTFLENITGDYSYNNCGINLRSTGESGSDFPAEDAWLHGSICAVSIAGGTDYHFHGGQLSANQSHAGFASSQDFVTGVWIGRNFIDGGIGSDGMPGIIPTPGTGAVGIVDFDGVDFEGTQFGWPTWRAYVPCMPIIKPSCNVIAYGRPIPSSTARGRAAATESSR